MEARLKSITKTFRCWFCDFLEDVSGSPIPRENPEFFIFGSAVDYCSNCEKPRIYEDDGSENGICLDEI